MSKRPRAASYGSQLSYASGTPQRMVSRRYGAKAYGKSRSSVRQAKKRVAILWIDRTLAKGLGFPQADTFPETQVIKLHYNRMHSITSTGTSGTFIIEEFYRLNNIFDPVVALGGAQPYYYDTLFGTNGTSAPYYNWRVLKTRVDIQFYNDNSSNTASLMAGCCVALNLNGVAATVAGSQLMMQRPNCRILPIAPVSNGSSVNGMTFFVDHKKLLGVKDMKDADDQVGSHNAGITGPEVSLSVFQFPVDNTSTTTIELWYRLHITFYVECRTLNTVSES